MDIQNNLITLADGNQMPQEGFGLYKVRGQAAVDTAVKAAYENGYRLFDTAQLYENEQEVGNAFKKFAIPREDIFVTTKEGGLDQVNRGQQLPNYSFGIFGN